MGEVKGQKVKGEIVVEATGTVLVWVHIVLKANEEQKFCFGFSWLTKKKQGLYY